ncbi:hypothetical protein [Leptospira noguchii]|uniref:Peptidase, M23 family n=1 Tax=Leptospira noguchii str. 2001034031 TaxID=1193053 RepID=M6XYS6_9LEPT|nr:hypothetical protein [Leptospira noguchii]EMO87257.1 hypothetical protein LEP1GSC024_0263 [Leptospira noguchii str. 2001034031]
MNLSYSAENGFGASVGVGYGPATIQAGISERGGTTLGIGFQYGAVNGGLNYSSKSNEVSGNIGLSAENGSNFALSYSQASGVGANAGYNHDSGVGGNVSWSQNDGFGGGLSYGSVQNASKTNSMAGTGANIAWSERGGTTVNITAASGKGGKNNVSQYGSGGATAGSWSSEGGFKTNSNFLDDKWAQDYLSDAEEHRQNVETLQSQGFSKDQASAILDARSQSESRAAQDRNNAQQGADTIAGAGYAGTRREGDHDEFSHGIGGDDLKKGLQDPDGFAATPGEKKFIEDRMKLDQAKAQGAEAYMAALKKGTTVERMPDSITTTKDGKEVRTYRHNDTDTDGSNIKLAMQTTTDPKTGKTTYSFARQQEFDLHPGVAPIVNLKDGKVVVNSPFGERWGRFHNGNDLAHAGSFNAPVDLENVKVTQGRERTNENGKAVGIWKESKIVNVVDPVTGIKTKQTVETLHTMAGDKPVPYTREMATVDYNAHPSKNLTYDQLMATPAKQMSKDGNSVAGTYRIGDQEYTMRFKHIQDLNQVRNSDGSFKTTISKGNVVGVIASTGYSTGDHGHFQVESGSYLPTNVNKYYNNMNTGKGKPSYSIDPVYFLNKMAGPNEVSEGRLWQ